MTLLALTQSFVAARMEEIVGRFKPGVKITVLVRTPGFPDRDFMMTDDTDVEIRAMLDRRFAAGPSEFGQPGAKL